MDQVGVSTKFQNAMMHRNVNNDIIMIFNCKNKTLEYKVNGQDCGVVCVSQSEIEIVDFSITNAS